MRTTVAALLFIFGAMFVGANGQVASGGNFSLEKAVLAGGGGTASFGNCLPTPDGTCITLTGTIGEAVAGTTSTGNAPGGMFILKGGFWQPEAYGPTAAQVSVSGRVRDSTSRGIRQAVVVFTAPDGTTHRAITNPFGYFRIDGIGVGEVYIVTVSAKQHTFAPMVLNLVDELRGLDLTMQ